MLYPHLEQRLQASKQAVNRATSESIVEQCKQYLALLAEYRTRNAIFTGLTGVAGLHTMILLKSSNNGSRGVNRLLDTKQTDLADKDEACI